MPRNYKKENEWKKNKYIEIRANIDRDLGEQLKAKLQKENLSVAEWIRQNAKRYIEG